ncbi:MAG: PKD domain-containing protein, partial [Thermoplasmata archaeon]|nr:PKD domain-containing protein [Thermoplasmata archaeon]
PARSPVLVEAQPSGGSGDYGPNAGVYFATWSYNTTSNVGVNATLNFTEPGTYAITLTLYDYAGVSLSTLLPYIATGPFSAIGGGTDARVGVPFTLTADPATGGNAPYTYGWSLGDGGTGTGASVMHVWNAAGTFLVTLFVVDAEGVIFRISETVTVAPAASAEVSASRVLVDAGEPVTFTPSVSGGSGSLTYVWNFGDGSPTTTGPSAVHTFRSLGAFAVFVDVADASGPFAEAWVTVTVNPALGGSVALTKPSMGVGAVKTFVATPTGGTAPFSFEWEFGDGSAGVGATTTHAYGAAGNYSAKVWINDSAGVSFGRSVIVTVGSNDSGSGGGPPSLDLPTGENALLVAAGIAGLAILGTAVYWRRRGVSEGDPAPEAPEAADDGQGPVPGP